MPLGMIKSLPGVEHLIDRRHYRHFLSKEGYATFYGAFDSFAHARKKLPTTEEFNKRELANEYSAIRMHRVFAYDYPVMFWLGHAFLAGSTRVYDIGGSVGVHYHAYKNLMNYPQDLSWEVCETPEIAQAGCEIAAKLGSSNLFFSHTLQTKEVRADVWISAGSLQYIENGFLHQLVSDCLHPPAHIILNKLPVYDGKHFVAGQNIGEGCYAPCHVYNRTQLIQSMEEVGYKLVDSWQVFERSLYLPGHPDKSFNSFSGMYFRKKNA